MKRKTQWIVAGAGILCLIAWAWDYDSRVQSVRAELEAVKSARNRAEDSLQAVRAEIQDANTIIATLRARPPTERLRTIIRDVPAECETCIGAFEFPYVWENEFIIFQTPDIFTESGKVELKPMFEERIIQPWRDALDICESQLKAKPGSPLRWRHEVEARVGLGMFGYIGQATYSPIEFGGSRFSVSPVAWVGMSVQPEVTMYGAVGVQVRMGK